MRKKAQTTKQAPTQVTSVLPETTTPRQDTTSSATEVKAVDSPENLQEVSVSELLASLLQHHLQRSSQTSTLQQKS